MSQALVLLENMTALKDLFTLIARFILGGVLLAHGWQKYNDWTIAGVRDKFQQMGTPSPEISAQLATHFELAGGALLILGLLVRIVGPILFVEMLGAFWFAHKDNGIFVTDGGWELVAVIGAAGLTIAAAGAGRISLDYLFATPVRRRREKKEAEERAAENQAAADQAIAQQNVAYASAPASAPASTTYSSSSDAETTQFQSPGTVAGTTPTHDAHGTQGTHGTQPVDPDAPTTQWPGTSGGSGRN